MGKIEEAVHEIHHIDATAGEDKWLNQIHPLPKLLVTLGYIFIVVSFHKYNLSGLLSMCIYPMIIMILGDVSLKKAVKRMKYIILLLCFVGIANPFLDHKVLFYIGNIGVSGGVVSMVTVMLKGVLSVTASYLLIISTNIEKICYALSILHLPKAVVTVVMLIYRYSIVLLKEVQRINTAYSMRAPKQKGIHHRAWGSLVGQLLLRSMDRGQIVYESMTLRGYAGDFHMYGMKKITKEDVLYGAAWGIVFVFLRAVPVFELLGHLK